MILYEIDQRIAEADKAQEHITAIHLGERIAPQFIVEATAAGHAISLDGAPTEYRGIPLSVTASHPETFTVETERRP
jgi:hypothetical protein